MFSTGAPVCPQFHAFDGLAQINSPKREPFSLAAAISHQIIADRLGTISAESLV
jgi:hypothetical protein